MTSKVFDSPMTFSIRTATGQTVNVISVSLCMNFDLMQNKLFQVVEILTATLTSVLRVFCVILVNMQPKEKGKKITIKSQKLIEINNTCSSACVRISNPWVPKELFFMLNGVNRTSKQKKKCKMFLILPIFKEICTSNVLFYCNCLIICTKSMGSGTLL